MHTSDIGGAIQEGFLPDGAQLALGQSQGVKPVRILEVGIRKISAREIRVPHVCASKGRLTQIAPLETRFDEEAASETDAG